MTTTTYHVKIQGLTFGEFSTEEEAVEEAQKYEGEDVVVVMVVKSGTYESRTVIHPEMGITRSN